MSQGGFSMWLVIGVPVVAVVVIGSLAFFLKKGGNGPKASSVFGRSQD